MAKISKKNLEKLAQASRVRVNLTFLRTGQKRAWIDPIFLHSIILGQRHILAKFQNDLCIGDGIKPL